MTMAIEVSALRKAYGDKRVLDGVDLRVEAGTVFGLLGPSGAGGLPGRGPATGEELLHHRRGRGGGRGRWRRAGNVGRGGGGNRKRGSQTSTRIMIVSDAFGERPTDRAGLDRMWATIPETS